MFGIFGRNKTKDVANIENKAGSIANGIIEKIASDDDERIKISEISAFAIAVTYKSYCDRFGNKGVVSLEHLCASQFLVAAFSLDNISTIPPGPDSDFLGKSHVAAISPVVRNAVRAYWDAIQSRDSVRVSNMLYDRSESALRPGFIDIDALLRQARI